MEQQNKNTGSPGIKPAEIIYILFRRKWLILLFTLAGFAGAAAFYLQAPASYSSEARLFIKYVVEKNLPTGAGTDSTIHQPDAGGNNILGSEVQVLTSYDLAIEVAEKVGATKLLPDAPAATASEAAAVVKAGLIIDVPRQSDVMRIVFQHPDPTVVQPVLSQLIASYLKKHDQIHRASGLFDEVLTQQTDALRSEVTRTEEDLRKLKLKTGISSLEDSKKAYAEQLSRIRQDINDTLAQMAERQASLNSMRQALTPSQTNATSQVTNPPVQVTMEVVNQYKSILLRLESLRKRELDLSQQFTGENLHVKAVQAQIADAMKATAQLEADNPGLLGGAVAVAESRSGQQTSGSTFDPILENARIASLQAKLETLQKLLGEATTSINAIHEAEPELLRLQRKKDIDEAQYRQFLTSLERARFDESLGVGRFSNIGVAQSPSPAARESQKLIKTIGAIIAGGIGLGLALAFALELYIKPSVNTASELERRLRTPVFLSIPALGRSAASRRKKALLTSAADPKNGSNGHDVSSANAQVVPWDPANPLQPYYEGLRDRVMTWFDNKGIARKPKLVAVTSCRGGAGTSSIAAGLAATFSETGDGRVLLVDMNVGQGAAHSFYKGKPGCGLDEALETAKLENAQVNDNLYVIAEGSSNHDKLPSVLPRRFTSLVPKLKATDFDYIIFDMPPVTPITMTPRLSAYMDMVLLVVEAEKTAPQTLKQAADLLSQSKANVAAVFNKTRSHGPKWLTSTLNGTQ